MRIGICEDERPVAEGITTLVAKYYKEKGMLCDIETFFDGASVLRDGGEFNLLFLDCRLPDKSGLEVAKELRDRGSDCVIVFISAFSEYVFKSFEVGTFRYLLKPVDESELKRTLDSFSESYENDIIIEIPTKTQTEYVKLSDVVYIESDKKHSLVTCFSGKAGQALYYESTKSLGEFSEAIHSPSFFRTHKRFLVNMRYICGIENSEIKLTVGEHAEISRRNMTQFNKAYNSYIKKSFS